MHVESHQTLEQLERLERDEPDAAKARRLRIIILALKGYTAPSIAMSLGPSRRICQRWVRRYNEWGGGSGRPPRSRGTCSADA